MTIVIAMQSMKWLTVNKKLSPSSLVPLVISGEQLFSVINQVGKIVARFSDDMRGAPAFSDVDRMLFLTDAEARQAPGEMGRPLDELLRIVDRAARIGMNSIAGNVLAYIPGHGLPAAALADLLSGIMNPYTGVGFCAPAMVALEKDVIGWLVKTMGLPETGGGILTSGGSMATLSAIAAARQRHFADGDSSRGTIYLTGQAHHCVAKSARLAGFPLSSLRTVPTDKQLRMDVDALKHAVKVDRQDGLQPFCIVATAGTTNAGTIDPLEPIAALAAEEGLWLHVDGAYGGFFRLTGRGFHRLRGIERADSLVLDPHKSLFLPYGTGCLLVRDRETLRRGHGSHDPDYMRDLDHDRVEDFSAASPELTRPNRGLRLWLSLHLHGVAAFRAALDEKLDLSESAYEVLSATPGIQVVNRPDLSIICFHYAAPGGSLDDDNRNTELLVQYVNDRGHVFLATTRIDGRVLARFALLSPGTSADVVKRALHDVRTESWRLSQRRGRNIPVASPG